MLTIRGRTNEEVHVKSTLALVVLFVVCIAGFGFYRGWFRLATEGSDHAADVTITVDRDKIRTDEEEAKKSAQELGHKAKERTTAVPASTEHRHEGP